MGMLIGIVYGRGIFVLSYCRQEGSMAAVTMLVSRYTDMFYVGEVWWPEQLYSLRYYCFAKKCYIVVHTVGTSE